jgi:hypothetical protein
MNTRITSIPAPDRELLRRLIKEALGDHPDVRHVYDIDLPWDGHPMLALDHRSQAIVIGYHSMDGGLALLSGLQALEEWEKNSGWLQRLYPELAETQSILPRLMIFTPHALPGIGYLKENISSHRFQALRINGREVLLVEPDFTHAPAETDANPSRHRMVSPLHPQLTHEEDAFFKTFGNA